MTHIKRAVGLLLLVLVALFVLPRVLPIPAVLADFGFHKSQAAQNAALWAGQPLSFASTSVCITCHNAQSGLWMSGNHRVVSCENCHGPVGEHIAGGAEMSKDTSREMCGTCHARLVSRPADFPQVDMLTMGGQAECVTCHNPHEPRAGMPPQVPHSMEGRSNCATCHSPQAHEPWTTVPPQAPHTMEGRSDCLSCHGPSDIRGAALPHVPVGLENTDCLLCHAAGGIKPLPDDHAGRKGTSCLNCHRVN